MIFIYEVYLGYELLMIDYLYISEAPLSRRFMIAVKKKVRGLTLPPTEQEKNFGTYSILSRESEGKGAHSLKLNSCGSNDLESSGYFDIWWCFGGVFACLLTVRTTTKRKHFQFLCYCTRYTYLV